jgi:hypothetical protein
MRYALTDPEWRLIGPILPCKPRGVPHVDDRACPPWHLLGVKIRGAVARSARALWPLHHLLQPLRPIAHGGHLGSHPSRCLCRRILWTIARRHCRRIARGTRSAPPTSSPSSSSQRSAYGSAFMSPRPSALTQS